jgi:putative DNA-invertase from lambdoid prophage Rac
MKAAVYLRVSTDRQDEANQEPDCLRVCTARAWEPILFRERISGASLKRPEWERLKDAVHRGEVGAVVFWAIDRAGRKRVDLFHDIEEFWRKNATVVSVREPMVDQPPGPMRAISLFWMAQVAEAERDRNRERTNAGLARAVAAGKRLGRRPTSPDAVALLHKSWREGNSPSTAAGLAGVPDSTARTYFARFETAKIGGKNAPQKTAERQEVTSHVK